MAYRVTKDAQLSAPTKQLYPGKKSGRVHLPGWQRAQPWAWHPVTRDMWGALPWAHQGQ